MPPLYTRRPCRRPFHFRSWRRPPAWPGMGLPHPQLGSARVASLRSSILPQLKPLRTGRPGRKTPGLRNEKACWTTSSPVSDCASSSLPGPGSSLTGSRRGSSGCKRAPGLPRGLCLCLYPRPRPHRAPPPGSSAPVPGHRPPMTGPSSIAGSKATMLGRDCRRPFDPPNEV